MKIPQLAVDAIRRCCDRESAERVLKAIESITPAQERVYHAGVNTGPNDPVVSQVPGTRPLAAMIADLRDIGPSLASKLVVVKFPSEDMNKGG